MTDPMFTDSIWLRNNHPYDADINNRTHGQHYIYENSPNSTERMEAIFRSMGRQHDWDLEKYRMAPKSVDKGNKRRFTKNMVRIFKNPFGYFYWASRKRFNNVKLLTFTITFLGLKYLTEGYFQSQAKQIKTNYLVQAGVVERGSGTARNGPYDDALMTLPVFLGFMNYSETRDLDIVTSASADQSYRKHFDLLRSYGLN